jgi:hypothetical protein
MAQAAARCRLRPHERPCCWLSCCSYLLLVDATQPAAQKSLKTLSTSCISSAVMVGSSGSALWASARSAYGQVRRSRSMKEHARDEGGTWCSLTVVCSELHELQHDAGNRSLQAYSQQWLTHNKPPVQSNACQPQS